MSVVSRKREEEDGAGAVVDQTEIMDGGASSKSDPDQGTNQGN
jgi:hypothetical protein